MKIDRVKIGAVIPVQRYGNLQPEIEISSQDSGEDLISAGMNVVKELFLKYSEVGGLEEKSFIPSVRMIKKSFNEPGVEIGFEPIAHLYTDDKDKKLINATDYIKKFYKPFDVDTISSVLESKWGIPAKVIKDLWDANGNTTSSLGNLIDETLCYYEKFKDYGEVISSKQGVESNYCLPKHPILRKIVEEFYTLVKDGNSKIETQVLLTDIKNGFCGTADRLKIIDLDKKICRVQDFKVNIEADKVDSKLKVLSPFNDLPANKISKYQLQLSFYANLLQASGWTVEGLDVFVYEDIWRHFELPVLQVIENK